jgi:hypothetical protein
MKYSIITILVLIPHIYLFAQNEHLINNSAPEIFKEEQNRIKFKDSLRVDFYKKPAIFYIRLEKDREEIRLVDNYEFWNEANNKRYDLRINRPNQFFVDSISDTINIVLKYFDDTLRFNKIEYSWTKNGAYLHFGIITNLESIRKYYNLHKRDEDFNKWTDLGEPYLGLLKNKKLKRYHRKVKNIYFVIVTPRTYGDGIMISLTTINAKK